MLLDANVVINPQVQQARAALTRELKKRRPEVFLCNLPTLDGVNGPDDYTAVGGDGAMTKLFTDASLWMEHCDYGNVGNFGRECKGLIRWWPGTALDKITRARSTR